MFVPILSRPKERLRFVQLFSQLASGHASLDLMTDPNNTGQKVQAGHGPINWSALSAP
jgi:hypothetical protein